MLYNLSESTTLSNTGIFVYTCIRKRASNVLRLSLLVISQLPVGVVQHQRCLLRISNVTRVTNICEAMPISLFRAPSDNEIPETMRFDVPFNLIGNQQWHSNKPIM